MTDFQGEYKNNKIMANQINIIDSVIDFYQNIENIIFTKECSFYVEKRIENVVNFIEIDNVQDVMTLDLEHYRAFYITSQPFDAVLYKNFYADDFFDFVIEGKGGRFNESEVENISLRLVSKKPDAKIKSISNDILKYLKLSSTYEMGIEPMSNSFYKNTFYNKTFIKNKTLWFDFERKIKPIEINQKK